MTSYPNIETKKLIANGQERQRELLKTMAPNRFITWHWTAEGFESAADWIKAHPHEVRSGIYLSDSPSKEVWRITVPPRHGDYEVVIKTYHRETFSWLRLFDRSNAVTEALNYATLDGLGIPVAETLACGEIRKFGKLKSSFIITRYIDNTIDGSSLMPGGSLADQDEFRIAFSKKALEIIARAHACGFSHTSFHPNKILISKNSTIDSQDLTLIDVAHGGFKNTMSMRAAIAIDLATFFIDMRLATEEIKLLCAYYLDFNPFCGFTVDTLWEALIAVD